MLLQNSSKNKILRPMPKFTNIVTKNTVEQTTEADDTEDTETSEATTIIDLLDLAGSSAPPATKTSNADMTDFFAAEVMQPSAPQIDLTDI